MILFAFFTQIALVNSIFNISETSHRISNILDKYKNHRLPRCTKLKLNSFVGKTVNVFDKTQRIGEYIKYVNVSACGVDSDYGASYINEHILSGLLVNENVSKSHWLEYKSVFKKQYLSLEHEMAAFSTWWDNLRRVARHNQQYLSGLQSYSLHLNHLGDLGTTDYFKKILKLIETPFLFDPAEDRHRTAYRKNLHRRVPRQVDWRAKGFTPRREEQSQCGACYAFAITHAVQAQLYKKHKKWGELSPQQIVDCSYGDGNMGCEGGSLRAALRYVAREGLIMEKDYPYFGKKGHCNYSRLFVRAKPRRWSLLPPSDERAMQRALATIGPLPVAVNAEPFTFQLYRSGIYDDPFCTPWKLNHAMLLVGYTRQYWLLLNWWGPNWGEDGYIRIRRGFNRCGVANMAAYVEL
ncbi:procathepsin L-like [Pectinophora gossypiella]|uniref:procathepsin L-like n=1 Tax=Pectinophora gossypiella TaxID=13191 RepID=UPI00214E381C|nr:procathepsin L-like [Pectinophora gossypiella]